MTDAISRGRTVILAPHADDEAIGCGALIARKVAAGTPVTVVIVTDGRNGMRAERIGSEELARIRRIEAVEAGAALGLEATAIRFLEFDDGSLNEHRTALRDALVAIVAAEQPDEIYAPHADLHSDHSTLNEVALEAFRGTNLRLYEYPVRYWEHVPWFVKSSNLISSALHIVLDPIREWRRPAATLVEIEGFRDQKLAALDAYAGEMESVGQFAYPYAQLKYEIFFPVTNR